MKPDISPAAARSAPFLALGFLAVSLLAAPQQGGFEGPDSGRNPAYGPGPEGRPIGDGVGNPGPGRGRRPLLGFPVGEPEPAQPYVLERIESRYRIAPPAAAGEFRTEQAADLVLAWPGFELPEASPELGHPSSLATDGQALVVVDRWNNRVLYWRQAPGSNTPPDRVFGQPNPRRLTPGSGRGQLASPASAALGPDGRVLAVADSRNDRVLIWKDIPERDGAAADVVLDLPTLTPQVPPDVPNWYPSGPDSATMGPDGAAPRPLPRFGPRAPLGLPVGVWTDGRRLAVVASRGACVLLWNNLPKVDHARPDLVLVPSDARNPRTLTSDGGSWFALTDIVPGAVPRMRTLVWSSFPTNRHQLPDFDLPGWRHGAFLRDRRLVLGREDGVELWDPAPTSPKDEPVFRVRTPVVKSFMATDAVVASGRLYVASADRQQVVAWKDLPATAREPDFVLGGGSLARSAWSEGFRLHDPILASDGTSLVAASGRDRKIFLWNRLPDEDGAPPDRVLRLPESPVDMAILDGRLVLVLPRKVLVWRTLPFEGGEPEQVVSDLGTPDLPSEFSGVAMDSRRFYLSDRSAGAIHVWEGVPKAGREPDFALVLEGPGRLHADGRHLYVASAFNGSPLFFRTSDFEAGASPDPLGVSAVLRLSTQVTVGGGRLFVANRSNNRIDVWNSIESALSGRPAAVLLGARAEGQPAPPSAQGGLVHPSSMVWAGGYLWVAESRQGSRILRFRPQ